MKRTATTAEVFGWLSALLNPVAGVLVGVFFAFGRKRVSYLAISFSFALAYMYFPLLWDVKNNFYRVLTRPEDGLNFYTYGLSFLVGGLGLSFMGAVFFFTLVLMGMLALAFEGPLVDLKNNASRGYFIVSLFLYFTLFEYRAAVDLQKTTLAIVCFVFAFKFDDWPRKVVFLSLSAFIHPFSLILISCYILAIFLKNGVVYFLILFIALMVGFFGSEALVLFAVKSQSLLPERVVNYMLLEPSRFSSEVVANFVRHLRVVSLLIIASVFLRYTRSNDFNGIGLSARLVFLICVFSVMFGFNEIFLERLYLAATFFAIYVALKYKISRRGLFLMAFFIAANVVIHGVYTLKVIFSEDYYDVVQSQQDKVDLFGRIFMYPSFFLLAFDDFGYSDNFILENARE